MKKENKKRKKIMKKYVESFTGGSVPRFFSIDVEIVVEDGGSLLQVIYVAPITVSVVCVC